MKRYLLLLVLALCCFHIAQAQKVGLVLSGGGAKGMTHIGIIRALEENNIPIDYIAGTSMGAIVGSLYAMGYSPDDMEALLRSPDFKRWYSGQVEPQYEYYFKKGRPTPEFLNIRFAFRDSLRAKSLRLPTSMVNPIQMNLVFVELFARSTAACHGNFDDLFVPFRCIASDVYNKKPLVMRNGDLGDAVRASMSFPFVFKPIEIDSILAYDGGIYNNFPTDVMREDFHPDVIIGSVVAANPSKPNENDLMSQIENMVMQKTDYSIPDSLGIVMTFKYDDVSLLDFDRLDELHDIGYNRTMSIMDSIKNRIHRRVNADNVRLRRMVYRSNLPQFRFRDIYIEGANAQQQAYIKKEFHDDPHEVFTYEDLKRGYFRLLADNMISEIIPHAVYDPQTDLYSLRLKVKMEDNFSVRIVIMMVNGNVGAGVAVAGAFSLVRFRSVPGTAKEIGTIFLAMAAGLIAGMGYLGFAVLFSLIMGLVMLMLNITGFGTHKKATNDKTLKITIPEDLNYGEVFDDLFEQYLTHCEVIAVKTSNMGSLYKLTYHIILKDQKQEKKFIDELRCRNGNLEISIMQQEVNVNEL